MQDQTEVQDQQDAAEGTVIATLEFGETYVFKGTHFKHGVGVPISAEDAEYLAETAVDTITVSRGGERTNSTQPKFRFETVGSAATARKSTARSR